MKIFGSTTNPLEFCQWLQTDKIPFSFNSLKLFHQNAVFDSVFQLLIRRHHLGNRRIVVFDVVEKLQTLNNVTIINNKNLSQLQFYLKTKGSAQGTSLVVQKETDQVFKTLEENKGGVMHVYNNNLYQVKSKELRDKLKNLFLEYCSGKLNHKQITSLGEELKSMRRNANTKEVVDDLMVLIQSDEFVRIRQTIIEVQKQAKPVSNNTIEQLATKHNVEAYDVRYLYKVLNK